MCGQVDGLPQGVRDALAIHVSIKLSNLGSAMQQRVQGAPGHDFNCNGKFGIVDSDDTQNTGVAQGAQHACFATELVHFIHVGPNTLFESLYSASHLSSTLH